MQDDERDPALGPGICKVEPAAVFFRCMGGSSCTAAVAVPRTELAPARFTPFLCKTADWLAIPLRVAPASSRWSLAPICPEHLTQMFGAATAALMVSAVKGQLGENA